MGRRGFTLIELVLSISLVSAVLIIALSSVRFGTRLWESGYRVADQGWVKRYFISAFQGDLASVFPYRGEDGIIFKGAPDRVLFVAVNGPVASLPWGGARLVEYTLVDGRLVMNEEALPRASEGNTKKTIELSSEVDYLKFAFLGPSGWIDDWDASGSDELPLAVKAAIRARGEKTETVFKIPVMAGRELRGRS